MKTDGLDTEKHSQYPDRDGTLGIGIPSGYVHPLEQSYCTDKSNVDVASIYQLIKKPRRNAEVLGR